MQATFLGNYQIDDALTFGLVGRDAAGNATWTPSHYDIVEIADNGTVASLATDQTMSAQAGILNNLFTPDTPVVLSTANGYDEGNSYVLIAKSGTGATPVDAAMFPFHIDKQTTIESDSQYIARTGLANAAIEGDSGLFDTVIGRAHTLELNQLNVIFPRLKRLLGLSGENMLADGHTYDDLGNLTSVRIRVFDTLANRQGAALWLDPATQADPASTLGTGEIYRVTQQMSHALPRNLRQTIQADVNADPSDAATTGSAI